MLLERGQAPSLQLPAGQQSQQTPALENIARITIFRDDPSHLSSNQSLLNGILVEMPLKERLIDARETLALPIFSDVDTVLSHIERRGNYIIAREHYQGTN